MQTKEIDFKDNSFINLYKSYCLSSKPFDEINPFQTISSLNFGSEEYLQILKESDLSVCSVFESWEIPLDKGYQRSFDKSNEEFSYIYFCFFKKHKKNDIELIFSFPGCDIMKDFDNARMAFYALCLYAMEIYKCNKIYGKIRRKNKKKPFLSFIKRYIKAIKYDERPNEEYDLITLNYIDLTEHYEHLLAKQCEL